MMTTFYLCTYDNLDRQEGEENAHPKLHTNKNTSDRSDAEELKERLQYERVKL